MIPVQSHFPARTLGGASVFYRDVPRTYCRVKTRCATHETNHARGQMRAFKSGQFTGASRPRQVDQGLTNGGIHSSPQGRARLPPRETRRRHCRGYNHEQPAKRNDRSPTQHGESSRHSQLVAISGKNKERIIVRRTQQQHPRMRIQSHSFPSVR